MKVCSACGVEKPYEEFHRSRHMKDGYRSQCRPCHIRQNAESDKRNPERVLRQQRKYRERNREKVRAATKAWHEANPKKRRMQGRVQDAVRSGRLVRPSACEECGKEGQVDGHHDDYDKPLDVRWLCCRCHKAHHAKESV